MRDHRTRAFRLVDGVALYRASGKCARSRTGCSLLESEPEYDTVTDFGGQYHFLVPQGWQSVADSSILAVYASEELPAEDQALDVLSIVVLSGDAVEETPPARDADRVRQARSAARDWGEAEISEPASITVGGRPGIVVEVTALDATGVPFKPASSRCAPPAPTTSSSPSCRR